MISKEEILVALIKSGYLLEDRVNKALTTNGWLTVPNMRYIDDQTGIEREIDIMALNHISMGNNYADYIHSSLLIECMNNKEPIVFFENLEKSTNRIAALSFTCFNNNFWEILLNGVISNTGIDNTILNDGDIVTFEFIPYIPGPITTESTTHAKYDLMQKMS